MHHCRSSSHQLMEKDNKPAPAQNSTPMPEKHAGQHRAKRRSSVDHDDWRLRTLLLII
ncbi:hypothetical protein RHGRI_019878 [Rhododendron griersonianum]|uniref:Uncharacterized protein n=1 Tax=Rhododendron griersonianum TaxID=479676 RepID=A0AAV6JI84_9ERIC|nr:hypothetical protein RHGRI_019878 [Rhododendron griersonianum]